MRIPKILVTILVASYVVVTSAEAAVARSEAGRDARGDVVSRSHTTDDPPTKVEPARRLGDIVANSASFGTDLVVTTKFRNLAATGQQEYSWFILTSEEEFNWTAHLLVAPGKDKGEFTLLDPIANQPDCGKAVLNRPQRTVTLTIPASCLRDPDWVKVGNGVFFNSATREYTDDARREGVGRNHWKYGPSSGPDLLPMPLPKTALASLLATSALVLGAAPSVAASERTRDPSGDVLSGPYLSDGPPFRPEPARRVGEIVSNRVNFASDLVVTTKFRSLSAGPIEQEFGWYILTSEDDVWFAALDIVQGSGEQFFTLVDSAANQPDCGSADLDRRARKVTLTIEADCLGSPRWVRVANGATFYVEGKRTYYDDARRDGAGGDWKLGPKVKRG